MRKQRCQTASAPTYLFESCGCVASFATSRMLVAMTGTRKSSARCALVDRERDQSSLPPLLAAQNRTGRPHIFFPPGGEGRAIIHVGWWRNLLGVLRPLSISRSTSFRDAQMPCGNLNNVFLCVMPFLPLILAPPPPLVLTSIFLLFTDALGACRLC